MELKEFAQRISGQEYPFSLQERGLAKVNRFLVLWGESDDLLELDGVTRDEAGAWEGISCYVGNEGVLPVYGSGEISEDYYESLTTIKQVKDLAKRFDNAVLVHAEWCPEGSNLSWRITADVPDEMKEKFLILEDGEPMCEGLVIKMPAPAP
ncbi:MAG: hypothetical protein AAGA46_03295 [Cyanobacteria bacterium P01_F01_bin.13]